MNRRCRFGFVGAGNMATALCRGIVGSGLAAPEEVVASDPDAERRRLFESQTGALTTGRNEEACEAEVVVLAVKPQVMAVVLAEIGERLTGEKLVITIAAGVPMSRIEAAATGPVRVVRAMPNTPVLVGKGAVAVCGGARATRADVERTKGIFGTGATVIEVREDLMHAVTALSGSGPAYVFYLAEVMRQAGVEMGLSEEDAAALSVKTILGAAHMLAETGEAAEELRRKVTSPGGTTEAAMRSMQRDGVAEKIIKAMKAACQRSEELGGEGDSSPRRHEEHEEEKKGR